MQQAGRRPAPPRRGLGTERLRGWGGGEESGRAFASHYDVEFSDDGSHWRTVRTVVDGNGGRAPLYLPESETRFVRGVLQDGPAHASGLAEMDVKDLAFGASPHPLFEAIAREAPRGSFPRGDSGEQL